MRARIVATKVPKGSIAKDYIESVEDRKRAVEHRVGQDVLPARQVLKVFEDHDSPATADPAVPVKGLIKVLTHDMQGMPGLLVYGDGREIGARLFKGCLVRLVGIPERKFVVVEIYWDDQEVRLREVGSDIEYVMPWDCVEFA